MTRLSFKSTVSRQIVQCLVMLAIAPPLALTPVLPAQANWSDTIANWIDKGWRFFYGEAQDGRPTGRARGGAIRDKVCLLADESSAVESVSSATTDESLVAVTETSPQQITETSPSEIVVLAPETPQKTTQATPDLFIYVPFDRNTDNMELEFELAIKETPTSRQIISGPISLPLPSKPGLMQFQFPAETPLMIGQTYEWTFRLICQGGQPTPDSESSLAASSASFGNGIIDIQNIEIPALAGAADGLNIAAYPALTVRQEVFGDIQRVDVNTELAAALVRSESSNRYQAYLANNIWFDMVSALAAKPSSEWKTLLKGFELADVDPAPQPLTSVALRDGSP